jgi:hypothetical protein
MEQIRLLPIKTAPTGNHTTAPRILLFTVYNGEICHVEVGCGIEWFGGRIEWRGRYHGYGWSGTGEPVLDPTHWLPLPMV